MMQSKSKDISPRKALGRGLSALLPERPPVPPVVSSTPVPTDEVAKISLTLIDPNPDQPRHLFRPDAIEELAQSIREDGVIQPIVVRRNGARFQIIVGERRWRAAKLAGLETIPAIIRDFAADRILEVTLVENIQREDLNPIEVALALEKMSRELHLSHEALASRTGKDRTTVTNLLRLLRLPSDIQELVAEHRLSMGHARALLALDDEEAQRSLAEKAAAQGLSVRQVERMVRHRAEPAAEKPAPEPPDPNVSAALEDLERVLGTKVRLVMRGVDRGKLEIDFYSGDDLDRIYQAIAGDNPG